MPSLDGPSGSDPDGARPTDGLPVAPLDAPSVVPLAALPVAPPDALPVVPLGPPPVPSPSVHAWPGRADGLVPELRPPTRSTAALRAAAGSYAVTHGTPLGRYPRRRVRWSVSWRLVGVAGATVLLLAGGVALRAASAAPGPPVALPVPAPAGTQSSTGTPGAQTSPAAPVVVDVVGAVRTQGVVRLPAGSRVVDAVAAAGGTAPDAEVGSLNLARLIVDGEQIVVPRPGDTPAPGVPAASADDRVDLNTADAAALDALPGIGPVLAARIVAHRDEGPYASVDDLGDVSGIGPTLLDRLRDLVRV